MWQSSDTFVFSGIGSRHIALNRAKIESTFLKGCSPDAIWIALIPKLNTSDLEVVTVVLTNARSGAKYAIDPSNLCLKLDSSFNLVDTPKSPFFNDLDLQILTVPDLEIRMFPGLTSP